MLESLLPAFESLMSLAKAMASFDSFRKGTKGDVRALIEEIRENSRLCFHVAKGAATPSQVILKFSTLEFDRLNRAGFDFNALKRSKIPAFPGLAGTSLSSWPGKPTSALVVNIYDKIKNIRSELEFNPRSGALRRRVINIHVRILLLLRHAKA